MFTCVTFDIINKLLSIIMIKVILTKIFTYYKKFILITLFIPLQI